MNANILFLRLNNVIIELYIVELSWRFSLGENVDMRSLYELVLARDYRPYLFIYLTFKIIDVMLGK